MESRADYLQSKINDRREEYLAGLCTENLQYLAQNYNEVDHRILIENIIDKGLDTKEFGQDYWTR